MAYTNINEGKRPVDMNDPRVIPTETVERDLRNRFPDLEFPYIKQDHVAGVRSNVHAYCEKHQMFSRMLLSSARTVGGTKYGCWACADEHKGGSGGGEHGHSPRRYAPGYIGRSGVQSGIFRAVKAVYPDAVWEHRMENGKEIDIFIPALGFGIEYNGNYYHSSAVGKSSDYHRLKSVAAIEENLYITHVFTDEVHDDFSHYPEYIGKCIQALKLKQLAVVHGKALKFTPAKARQLSRTEAIPFIKRHSITYLCDSVLDLYKLFVGVYEGGELKAVLAGSAGTLMLTAVSDVTVDLRVGVKRFAQHAKSLQWWAAHRCWLDILLQDVYGAILTHCVEGGMQYKDMKEKFTFCLPMAYGLGRDNKLVADPRDGVYEVHDCGWASLRMK